MPIFSLWLLLASLAFIVTVDDVTDSTTERLIGTCMALTFGTMLLRTCIDVRKVFLAVCAEGAGISCVE